MACRKVGGGGIIYPAYAKAAPGRAEEIGPSCHVLGEMCRQSGILGEVSLRPYFEVAVEPPPKLPKDFIAISAMGSRYISLKNWFLPRYRTLARSLRKEHTLVQLGSLSEPALPDVMDMRGRTTIVQAAAVLRQARCFIGQLDGLMHLARAVDCPAVIIFGGRESVRQSGYTANINLFEQVSCSPCWRMNDCPHEMGCLEPIQPRDVASAVERLLNRGRKSPLPCEKYVIRG